MFLAAAFPGSSSGQAKPVAAKRPSEPKAEKGPPPPPPVQQGAFVPGRFAAGLPVGFGGVTPAELVTALADLTQRLKKDEYETTVQYNERRTSLLAGPFLRNIATSDRLAVAVTEPQVVRSYDADSGQMKVELTAEQNLGTVLSPAGFRLANSQRAIRGGAKVQDSKNAVFMNAYGAKWEGKEIFAEESLLIVPAYVPTAFTFPLSQDQARALRDSKFAVLVVGKLETRELVESATSAKASVGSPDDVFVLKRACRLAPEEVWVYDVVSGKVLSRTSLRVPALSRQGIELGVESLLGDYEVLAPSPFLPKTDSQSLGIVNEIYNAKSSEPVPRLTVTGVITRRGGARARPDLPLALSEFVKALEARNSLKLINVREEDAPVAGMLGKQLTARMEGGLRNYYVGCRAFECLDLLQQAQQCMLTV